MAKNNEEIDIDEEIKRISRKTNVDVFKSERTFDNRIKNLEREIEKASQTQLNDFDKNKELVGKYLSTDYSSSTIDNYRRKLKKFNVVQQLLSCGLRFWKDKWSVLFNFGFDTFTFFNISNIFPEIIALFIG